jgi:hypothetical protein
LPWLFSASAASWARSGFAVAPGYPRLAPGPWPAVPLSSHPVNENAVRSASDSAAKRNGFILLTPRPVGLMQIITLLCVKAALLNSDDAGFCRLIRKVP